jgi:porin
MVSVTVPITLVGRTGYQGFKGIYSTKKGTNLSDVPELLLPPEAAGAVGTKQGSYFLGYAFQQYLVQSPTQPQDGWGVFGQVGFSDGNPNPAEWSALAGIGGTRLLPSRPLDRFGVAYFRFSLSGDLVKGLRPLLPFGVRDEQGMEAFYSIAITPWLRITGDLQVVEPFRKDKDTAVFLGLRTQIKF